MMAAQALANAKQPISGNATVSGSPVGASFLPPSSGSGVGVGGSGVGGGPGGLLGRGGGHVGLIHPTKKEEMHFDALPPMDAQPWKRFDAEIWTKESKICL